MSRRRTNPEDIKNPEHYFNSYIAKETRREQEAAAEYYEFFDSLTEAFPYGLDVPGRGKQLLAVCCMENDPFEHEASETSLLGWIDQIEDRRLYTAINGLTERQKILLSLRYQQCLSQKDTALAMGITQQMVSSSENRILKKIKKYFQ